MSKRVKIGVAICLVGLAVFFFATNFSRKPLWVWVDLVRDPITISASRGSAFAGSWNLEVDKAGRAELTIQNNESWTRRPLQVSAEQLLSLRQALQREHFFYLADEYGEIVPDGSSVTLRV